METVTEIKGGGDVLWRTNVEVTPDPIVFKPWPKTPRLFREMTITEKIDGSNGAIIVTDDGQVAAQSRNRLVTPGKLTDNYGFARWVEDNAPMLAELLGAGYHYGEWWGGKIARGYGLQEKRFSLFNTQRYKDVPLGMVDGLGTVPVLYQGAFDSAYVQYALNTLIEEGSVAAPGFMQPEGVIVYHSAAQGVFKVLIENDHLPKGV